MKRYLKLMRIQHYLKNFLIFLPLAFSGKLFNVKILEVNLLGFLSFCFIASFIYIVNDIADVNQDKLHPIKCKRPIASGAIERKNAIIFAVVLFIISSILNYFVYINSNHMVFILWSIYILINIAYSLGLKRIPGIDVILLAMGFLIRVLYGGVISGIEVSNWLCCTVLATSIYMSLGKRRNELKNQGECVRKALRYYNYKIVNILMYVSFILTLCFYTLWCITVVMTGKFHAIIYITIALVFVIIARYSKDIEGKVDGDPVNVLLKDRILVSGGLIYATLMYFIVY